MPPCFFCAPLPRAGLPRRPGACAPAHTGQASPEFIRRALMLFSKRADPPSMFFCCYAICKSQHAEHARPARKFMGKSPRNHAARVQFLCFPLIFHFLFAVLLFYAAQKANITHHYITPCNLTLTWFYVSIIL